MLILALWLIPLIFLLILIVHIIKKVNESPVKEEEIIKFLKKNGPSDVEDIILGCVIKGNDLYREKYKSLPSYLKWLMITIFQKGLDSMTDSGKIKSHTPGLDLVDIAHNNKPKTMYFYRE